MLYYKGKQQQQKQEHDLIQPTSSLGETSHRSEEEDKCSSYIAISLSRRV